MNTDEQTKSRHELIEEQIVSLRNYLEKEALLMAQEQSNPEIRVVGFPPPPPIDLFHGRKDHVREVVTNLRQKSIRIVAIIGQAGMGKTALARKALNELAINPLGLTPDELVGGIVYLSTLTSGISLERIYSYCAKLIGGLDENDLISIWQDGKKSPQDKAKQLIQSLQNRSFSTIILLDNMEDKLKDGQIDDRDLKMFMDLLREEESKGKARLLITTREEILPMGKATNYKDIWLDEGLDLADSIALLMELDPGHLGLIGAESKCKDLALSVLRIPRALELIVSLLDNNSDLTVDKLQKDINKIPHGREEDQKIIVKSLAQKNYDLLGENRKRIVQALAIYKRPVPVVAVNYLLFCSYPDWDASEEINKLVLNHTILSETPAPDQPISKLLALHPLDQEIIRESMQKDLYQIYRRYNLDAANYYSRMRFKVRNEISHLDPQLLEIHHRREGKDYKGALAVLDSIDYSLENQHKYRAFLMAFGYGKNAIEGREQLITSLGESRDNSLNLTSLGWVCRRMGIKDKADRYFKDALKCAEQSQDKIAQIYVLSEYGYFLTDNAGEHQQAEANLKKALELSMEIGDQYLQAHSQLGLAFVEFQRGHNKEALEYACIAETNFRGIPDDYHSKLARFREIDCLVRQNMIFRTKMDYEQGNQVTARAYEIAKQPGLEDWQAELESQYGFNDRGIGAYKTAIEHHSASLELFRKQRGMRREEAVQYSYIGNLYTDLGQFREAESHYTQALEIAETIGINREASWILSNQGLLFSRKGDYGRAIENHEKALKKITKFDEHGNFLQYLHADSATIRLTDKAFALFGLHQDDEAQNCVLKSLHDPAGIALPEAYLKTSFIDDKLPHEMQSPGDHQRRGVLLARIYLRKNELENAYKVIQEARHHDVIAHRGLNAVLCGVICLRIGQPENARSQFDTALEYTQEIINKAPSFYEAHYARGLALAGLVLLEANQQTSFLNEAGNAYETALKVCSEKGVIEDAAGLLDDLRVVDATDALTNIREILGSNGK